MAMNVQSLAWLSGQWMGHCGDDPVEEHWSTPAAGVLMGMFRWIKEDTVYIYEFLTIESEGETLLLRIKHFHLGGIGVEAKEESTEFVLERCTPTEAAFRLRGNADTFRRLVYRHPDPNTLTVVLELEPTGERVFEFHYQQKG
jgi:hypothetical protein